MKHLYVAQLAFLIILLNSCTVFKHKKQDTYKAAVATVLHPKGKSHTENITENNFHHFSVITFPADSAGQSITIRENYDAKENTFLYFHSKEGDRFSVRYDSLNPHHYKVCSNKPRLDQAITDTTLGKVSKVYPHDGYVEYAYTPEVEDSLEKSRPVLYKIQDIRSDSLENQYPDLKKDDPCPVVYNRADQPSPT